MIVYAYDKGEYITLEESLKRQPEGKRAIYVNLTNRCTCSCTFCLRSMKKMAEETTLWLKKEPTAAEVKALLDAAPWDYVGEVVFCGFGEPTERLEDLKKLLAYVKKLVAKQLQTPVVSEEAVPYRSLTREEQIAEVNEMCEEIKLIRAGKLKGRPAEELLNEL